MYNNSVCAKLSSDYFVVLKNKYVITIFFTKLFAYRYLINIMLSSIPEHAISFTKTISNPENIFSVSQQPAIPLILPILTGWCRHKVFFFRRALKNTSRLSYFRLISTRFDTTNELVKDAPYLRLNIYFLCAFVNKQAHAHHSSAAAATATTEKNNLPTAHIRRHQPSGSLYLNKKSTKDEEV